MREIYGVRQKQLNRNWMIRQARAIRNKEQQLRNKEIELVNKELQLINEEKERELINAERELINGESVILDSNEYTLNSVEDIDRGVELMSQHKLSTSQLVKLASLIIEDIINTDIDDL